jgi:hypothetical protein
MKYTVYDRLAKREIGQQRKRYTDIRGIYGDRQWVEDLDIVNELEGHHGCVNALRYALSIIQVRGEMPDTAQLVDIRAPARLRVR